MENGPVVSPQLFVHWCLCSPFNLDASHPRLFPGPPEAEFGYSVLQHVGGGRRWMLVGAPWDGPSGDRRGDVYLCPVEERPNASCAKGHLGDYPLGNSSSRAVNMHLGMSLLKTDADGGFMACAPLWSRACGTSVFSSGICAQVDASFRPRGSLAPTAQRCPTYMDVVIVLDGSNSIYPWTEVQTFLRRLVGRLFIDPEQIQVGLVQYGETAVHEWSLGDFRTKEEVVRAARNLSRREGRETHTAQAIMVGGNGRTWGTGNKNEVERDAGRQQTLPPPLMRITLATDYSAFFGSYSVSSLSLLGGRRLFLSGAPRFKHRGKVIAFQLRKDGTMNVAQSLQGEQIGSYFGSELCPLDTDGDGVTDILLVAAPMYLGPQNRETGRVYVYLVGQSMLSFWRTLQPEPPQDSRFGFAMGALPDLNQDGFADVAVGAPLEDGHRGALYLYHGSQGGIRPRPAQVRGSRGTLCQEELGECRLPDRRPLLPSDSQTPGRWNRRFYIRFSASLDERTAGARAAFDGFGQRLPARRLGVSVGNVTCQQLHFHVLDASDYLRPVALAVTFELDNSTKPGPVLAQDAPTSLRKLVPFSKDCGPDNECHTDLVLRVDMDIKGSRKKPFVVRGGRRKVLVSAALENTKENAYHTNLSLSFSKSLHLTSLTPQKDAAVKVECAATSSHGQLCSVGHPVFQTGARVTLALEFEFSCSCFSPVTRLCVSVLASHDSVSLESTLHRYEVHPYGVLPESPGPEFKTTLRVQNLGCYSLPGLVVSAFFPAMAHGGSYFLSLSQIITYNASCTVQNLTEPSTAPMHSEDLRHTSQLNGSNTWRQAVRCHLGHLPRGTEISVQFLRLIHDEFFRRAKFKSVTVVSSFKLGVEEGSVLQLTEAAQGSESLLEIIQARHVPVSLWILVGSVLGGLLLLALIVFCLWKVRTVPQGMEAGRTISPV
uniref:Integrin subunit alpha 10 n=1 Tax=Monodelphis domestica TaxID=13616 RepID=F7BI58_MONDO